jgi:hypothetical protein
MTKKIGTIKGPEDTEAGFDKVWRLLWRND